ncbi:luciferase domain-containing protein [Nocardia veterana]|uniref:Phospholipase n=1 Tax=Nocardia veterana TaxID=132249 RepID=A0A7X6M095_9NOCA|nr:luciferase family protein [Nocardia veterana]NKY87827.1 phospholipase [Nocardia veterana]
MTPATANGRTDLPRRRGERPLTRPHNPHQQLSQNAGIRLQESLWARMRSLPGVVAGPSLVSLPDTRALHLTPDLAHGPAQSFLAGTEFAHLHGPGDGSLHLCLPARLAGAAIAGGWAEPHPMAHTGLLPASLLMVYGPRDADELEQVWLLVRGAYTYARGTGGGRAARACFER